MRYASQTTRAPNGARVVALCAAAAVAFLLPPATHADGDGPPSTPADPGTVKVDDTAGTVTGSLQGQEGVRIQTMCTHCNSANIQVGGQSQDLVPLTFGGFPLFGGLATSFVLNMLLPDSVAEAQVARGPGEARAPAAAAGGTITLLTATPRELPWVVIDGFGGSFGRRGFTARVAAPLAPWLSVAVTGGRDVADAADDDHDGWNDVAASNRRIGDARVFITPSRSHRIEIGGSWIKEDDTDSRGAFDSSVWLNQWLAGGEPGTPFWTREDAHFTRDEYRAGWDWRLPWSGTLTLKLLRALRYQGVVSQDTRDPGSFLATFYERYKIKERDEWGLLRYTQPVGLEWRIAAGIESMREWVKADAFTLGPSGPVLDQTAVDYVKMWSGFVEAGWTPSAHWDFDLGVRRDKDENYGSATSPRISIKFHPADGWTIRALAGKTFRPPKPIFSEVCCGRKYLTNAEAGVRSEKSTTYGVEGLYQPSPDFKVSVYAARTDFTDHILQLATFSVLYRQIYALANVPEARSDTAEIAVRWTPVRGVRLDGSAGWLRFRNTGDTAVPVTYRDFFNTIRTESRTIDRVPYRPVSSGSLGASFALPRGISLNAQANYTGALLIQQWTRITDLSQLSFSNQLEDEMRPIRGFWVVNVGGTAPLGGGFELSAGIDNMTNRMQWDLHDPTRDYNWGPLTGRTYRFGLRYAYAR